jgi:uncharacterized alpha-E superfamily protein
LISRVAEACFWLNRHLERVESLARLLDVNLSFQLDVSLPEAECWLPLVVVVGQEAHYRSHVPASQVDRGERVQSYLVWDEENPVSIVSALGWARENARTIRETISLEMWETLNSTWLWLDRRSTRNLYERDRHAFYVSLRDRCHLFHGVAQATMLHEDPFEFMRLGSALERASQTARILDVKHHSIGPGERGVELPAEAAQWLATLRSCAAVEPFYKRPENTLSGAAVARFLLFDRVFPRSVLHNLLRARNFLQLVRPPAGGPVGQRAEQLLAATLAHVEQLDPRAQVGVTLHRTLTRVVAELASVCEAIHAEFFDPAPLTQQQRQTQIQS